MCETDFEGLDHLLLHYPIAFSLWPMLFREDGISWVIPVSCAAFYRRGFCFFGGKKGMYWGGVL